MSLTKERIDQLAKGPNIRGVAVTNFLSSLSVDPDSTSAELNLRLDSRQYDWNAQTIKAIRKGIKEHYRKR